MLREVIVEAETIEEAIQKGCEELEKSTTDIEYEILEEAKRNLFGKVKTPAKVKVYVDEVSKAAVAAGYVKDVLAKMGLENVEQEVVEEEDSIVIRIEGEDLGVIIGRRGETLNSLQYLTSLVANRDGGGEFTRVVIDSGEFRAKREETLKELARKIAKSVGRSGRSTTLEPMNPYERRIIHSVITETDGVSSKSVGEGQNRRVVVSSTNPRKPYNKGRGGYNKNARSGGKFNNNRSGGGGKFNSNRGGGGGKFNNNRNQGDNKKPYYKKDKKYDKNYEIPKDVSSQPSTYNFEKEFLKKSSSSKDAKLYGKIEFDGE